jgi:hypothetical protein
VRWRADTTVDPARVVDVRFDQLVADQAGVVAGVYEQLEIPMPPAAKQRVAQLLAAKPRGRHGGHEHTFDDLGLDLAEQRARFATYQEHFGIRSE